MSKIVTDYCKLIDEYDRMIRSEPWHDGRRDKFVRERMDPLLRNMTDGEKAEATNYSAVLYQRHLCH